MPTFPEWWNWNLSFTGHAELRMEQRGVTEVEVRVMLERATGFEASVVEGRFMIQTRRGQSPWIVDRRARRRGQLARRRDRLRGPNDGALAAGDVSEGRTFAAYLHLSHPTGEKSARTVASPDGLLIVDYAASGRPLGVEITAPQGGST